MNIILSTKWLKVTFNESSQRYHFDGTIDDSFDAGMSSLFTHDMLVFDFEKLNMINSIGILRFINFLNKLNPSQNIIYENVPATIVNQMSLVSGLISARFKIKSFYVPYVAKDSDEQIMVKLNVEEVLGSRFPPKSHPVTNALIQHDVNEEKFLNFLKL